MQMSNLEILSSYKQAKDPLGQVKILAQLNGTDVGTINEILRSQGVDGKKLPRPTRKPNKSENDVKISNEGSGQSSKVKRANKQRPDTTIKDVFQVIQTLKEQKKALEEEIADIDETLSRIATMCKSVIHADGGTSDA